MSTDPRRRMIQSAAFLMREHGVEATSFSAVIDHSGAPRGSIYHHFPGGKAQLVAEATRYGGDFIAAGLVAALAQDDPAAAIRRFTAFWQTILTDGDFAAGCPIVAAALDPDRASAARDEAGAAFMRWEDILAEGFESHGAPSDRARSLATLVIAAIEGAVVLARGRRSIDPLERVAGELERIVAEVSLSSGGRP
jgi:AcrR family transcriptional regulator